MWRGASKKHKWSITTVYTKPLPQCTMTDWGPLLAQRHFRWNAISEIFLSTITKGPLALFCEKEHYLHQLTTQAVVLCQALLPGQFPGYSVLFCLDNWAAFATQLLLNYSVSDYLWLGLIVQHLQDRLIGRTVHTGLTATAHSQRCAWRDLWVHCS